MTRQARMEQALSALLAALPPGLSDRKQAEFLVAVAVGYARTSNAMSETEVVEHVRKLYLNAANPHQPECHLCTRLAAPDSLYCPRHAGGVPVPEDYERR